MKEIERILCCLERERHLSKEDFNVLLSPSLSEIEREIISERARIVTRKIFGNKVRIRGLLELTNICRNDCFYCGLRKSNKTLERYTLTIDDIMISCQSAYDNGFRTFVIQGGENPALGREKIENLISCLHQQFPDSAITLSLGEWDDESFEVFRKAGASRYLLRHETFNASHYSRLHPPSMSRDNRLRCIHTLKRLGYQTGTGFMVGSPFQTIENIIEDLEFLYKVQPEMIGIGPFIPYSDTPFGGFKHGSIDLTIRLISILRLMFPYANIPATTALATLRSEARIEALNSGANVVMPNITPIKYRGAYMLYDHKASTGTEAMEGLELLQKELNKTGLEITMERGDFKIDNQYV